MQGDFSETLIGKQSQNEGEKKMTRQLTQKTLKDSVKDESKMFVDDKPKKDGSIVGISESEKLTRGLR